LPTIHQTDIVLYLKKMSNADTSVRQQCQIIRQVLTDAPSFCRFIRNRIACQRSRLAAIGLVLLGARCHDNRDEFDASSSRALM